MTNRFEPTALVVPFEQLRNEDVEVVGGKNASLGEMISQLPNGVRVPTGFATTAHAFRQFLQHDGLADRISQRLAALDTEDVRALAEAGAEIRGWVEAQPFPADLEQAIRTAYAKLAKWAFGDLRHAVKIKHGPSDAFRDRVDWNTIDPSGSQHAS